MWSGEVGLGGFQVWPVASRTPQARSLSGTQKGRPSPGVS